MALKVMTIVGTRPEIIKLSRVIAELDKHTSHVLVHTGQNFNYELNDIFFNQLKIRKPDYYLDAAEDSLAESIGSIIIKADKVMEQEKPDAILFYGDTNSCLSVISAKRRKIPVFHMEAGNRCFDQRIPEEINRKVIDHLSDINMPITEHARRYLIAEGIRPETVIKIGSPMTEVFNYYLSQIKKSDVLAQLNLLKDNYFLVSAHREENVDSSEMLAELMNTLNMVAAKYDKEIIFSIHPRTQKRLEQLKAGTSDKRITFLKPLGFLDYIKLQLNAFCVLSDSGTITEEAAILNLPAITIRETHERPEGMDEGILVMSGLKQDRVMEAIEVIRAHHSRDDRQFNASPDYDSANVSKKVLRIILSYTDYINRTIWNK